MFSFPLIIFFDVTNTVWNTGKKYNFKTSLKLKDFNLFYIKSSLNNAKRSSQLQGNLEEKKIKIKPTDVLVTLL